MDIASQTEQALIGALLVSPSKFLAVHGIVSPGDFTDDRAKKAFVIAQGLWQKKKKVDLITVSAEDMSLVMYLSAAMDMGTPFACTDYAQKIATCAKAIRISTDLGGILNNPADVQEKLGMILSLYQREMDVTAKDPSVKKVLARFEDRVRENKKRGSMGIPTGFGFLDDLYVQYVPGHLWTIGAYTSVGKTAVMVQKICNLLAMDSDPSQVVISTEMTEEQLMSRILANFTGVHSHRILSGDYWNGEEEIVDKYKRLIKDKRLAMYDDIYTLRDIETVFRKADLQGGIDIGWIDYVQNCRVPEAKSAYQEGSMLAKGIQKLAKDVRATAICLSQVSNDVGRGNTDQLELKGAGEWAAVSDVGIMLHRSKADKYALLYRIAKNRHGALHEHHLEYKDDYTRIEAIGPIIQN